MKRMIIVGLALAAWVGLNTPVWAGSTKNTKPTKPEPILVKSVDVENKTLTVQRKGSDPIDYTLDNFTRITVNGKTATLNDVKEGMRADVTTGSDGKKATRLDATTYTPPKDTKKKK